MHSLKSLVLGNLSFLVYFGAISIIVWKRFPYLIPFYNSHPQYGDDHASTHDHHDYTSFLEFDTEQAKLPSCYDEHALTGLDALINSGSFAPVDSNFDSPYTSHYDD